MAHDWTDRRPVGFGQVDLDRRVDSDRTLAFDIPRERSRTCATATGRESRTATACGETHATARRESCAIATSGECRTTIAE